MLKRALALAVCIALCICLSAPAALAAAPTALYAGGVLISANTYHTTDASGVPVACAGEDEWNIFFDGTTLTLRDAVLAGPQSMREINSGIYADGDLILQLEGDNRVTKPSDMNPNENHVAISVGGSLSIAAAPEASLTVLAENTSAYANFGSYGIQAMDGITITGGNVRVTATSSAESDCYGLTAGHDITVTGGTVVAETRGGASSYGIYSYAGKISVSGGTVRGNVQIAKHAGYGVRSAAGMEVGGEGSLTGICGALNANAADTPNSIGVYSKGDIAVSGKGILSGTGGDVMTRFDESAGIKTEGTITVSGGTLTGTGGSVRAGSSVSAGVSAAGSITVLDGSLTGTGGSAVDGSESYGIEAPEGNGIRYAGGALLGRTGAQASAPNARAASSQIVISYLDSYGWRTGRSDAFTLYDGRNARTSTEPFPADGHESAYVELAVPVTVAFSPNGGIGGSMAQQNAFYGAEYTLPQCGFTAPAGFRFAAWAVGDPETGEHVLAGNTYAFTAEARVYALWAEDTDAPVGSAQNATPPQTGDSSMGLHAGLCMAASALIVLYCLRRRRG